MDEQENEKTYVSEVRVNELMLRLGFHWVEPNLWVMDGDISHDAAVEAVRKYEDDV